MIAPIPKLRVKKAWPKALITTGKVILFKSKLNIKRKAFENSGFGNPIVFFGFWNYLDTGIDLPSNSTESIPNKLKSVGAISFGEFLIVY